MAEPYDVFVTPDNGNLNLSNVPVFIFDAFIKPIKELALIFPETSKASNGSVIPIPTFPWIIKPLDGAEYIPA